MIGVLLAAGAGTRLSPITKVCNKLVLPIYDKPMIYYPLQTLLDSGISEVVVVVGEFKEQIKVLIEQFPHRSQLKVKYVIQKKLNGMAGAIKCVRPFTRQESIFVIAGDNVFVNNFKIEVGEFEKGAVSFLRKVYDPHCFGVPYYHEKRLIKIVEKPKKPPTNWIVSGPHLFDKNVYYHIEKLIPSARGELEITDLNSRYIDKGLLRLKKRTDYWADTGTFESLLKTSVMIQKLVPKRS